MLSTALIVVWPSDLAVIFPLLSTVAIFSLLLVHVIVPVTGALAYILKFWTTFVFNFFLSPTFIYEALSSISIYDTFISLADFKVSVIFPNNWYDVFFPIPNTLPSALIICSGERFVLLFVLAIELLNFTILFVKASPYLDFTST